MGSRGKPKVLFTIERWQGIMSKTRELVTYLEVYRSAWERALNTV